VRLAIKRIDPDARPEMRHVERVLACVAEGSGSVTLPAGIDARVEFGTLSFKAPAAREGLVADWVTIPGRLPLGAGRILVAEPMAVEPGCDIVRRARELAGAGGVAAMVDAATLGFADRDSERMLAGSRGEIPAGARLARLWVDGPAPGDVMCPLGMSGRSKKVSDLLNEARIPVSERAGVPVVRTAPGGAVVWVAGVRTDERFKCTAATRVAYLLRVVDAE
ncbi:MAG: tRNA lysidine(34) synthetase TilS, partial [Eggerthella lenta]